MVRSILSVPGNQLAMIRKARLRGADRVAWDLEDSVAVLDKAEARANVAEAAAEGDAVRVNAIGTTWFRDDVAALYRRVSWINLPKVEDERDVAVLRQMAPSVRILAVIESPKGVVNAAEICRRVDAVAFGRADFMAASGLRDPEMPLIAHAMAQISLAALAAGIPAYDSPCEVFERAPLQAEIVRARGLGYTGKICIHPDQVAACMAFGPTPSERVEAAELARFAGRGAMVSRGALVAEPHYRAARHLVDLG